jgi:hypothetical protein
MMIIQTENMIYLQEVVETVIMVGVAVMEVVAGEGKIFFTFLT